MVKGLREEIAQMPYPRLMILLLCVGIAAIAGSITAISKTLYADVCSANQKLVETERRHGIEKSEMLEKILTALNQNTEAIRQNAKTSDRIAQNQEAQNHLIERMMWRDGKPILRPH